MAVTTISDYERRLKEKELSRQYSGYYESLLGLQTAAQAGYQETAGQIQEQTTANISQAYANYLAQQRAYTEYPTISSGDVARLSSKDLSSYGTAYQAYKAKELSQLSSTASEYQKQLETGIANLNKEYSEYENYYDKFIQALDEYAPTAAGYGRNAQYVDYLNQLSATNDTDVTFNRLLALGTGADRETFIGNLLASGQQDLADWYIANRASADIAALGGLDIDTRRTTDVDETLRKLISNNEKYNILQSMKKQTGETGILSGAVSGGIGIPFEYDGKVYMRTGENAYREATQEEIDRINEISKNENQRTGKIVPTVDANDYDQSKTEKGRKHSLENILFNFGDTLDKEKVSNMKIGDVLEFESKEGTGWKPYYEKRAIKRVSETDYIILKPKK